MILHDYGKLFYQGRHIQAVVYLIWCERVFLISASDIFHVFGALTQVKMNIFSPYCRMFSISDLVKILHDIS